MGTIDINSYNQNAKKTEFPFLCKKKSTPNLQCLGSSKGQNGILRPTSNCMLSAASYEHFEKSKLVALQEAALHDSTVLEMGYEMTDCDSTLMSEEALLTDASVGPLVGNPLDGKDQKALKPVSLRDLKVGKVHRGRMLSGTLCCKTVKTSAVMNVLEEEGTDDATRLVISNCLHKRITTAKSQLLYPKGAKVAIQAPYLKQFPDGMVGLLVENLTDIIFTYLPKELPCLEEKNVKVELASKRRVSNVQTEQSTSNKELTECFKKILFKQHIDVDVGSPLSPARSNGSEEQLLTPLKSILGVGVELRTEMLPPTNKGGLKVEGLAKIEVSATHTVAKDDLNSRVDPKASFNPQNVPEQETCPHNAVENHKLVDLVKSPIVAPETFSKECELTTTTKPPGPSCQGRDRNLADETDIVKYAPVDQQEKNKAHEPHQRPDAKAILHESNEVTSGGNIVNTPETSVGYTTKLVADHSPNNSTPTQGSIDCNPEVCESSNAKLMENSENEVSPEEGRSSLSETIPENDSDTLNSKSTLEIDDADATVPEAQMTPSALRLLGNKQFEQQNWAKAIELYTQATFKAIQDSVQETKENLSPNQDKIAGSGGPQKDSSPQKEDQESEVVMDYSNRAEAWLRIHQYERAWADSERALSVDPNHLKSLFRKGRALLGLGDYQQALAHFEAANARTPFDKDVQAAIRLARTADLQNRLGIYDLTDYYLRGRFAREVPNCADYIGPVQVMPDIRDKGRGLFLTKSVEAGDLLLVSNPIAFLPLEPQPKSMSDFKASAKRGPTASAADYNPRVTADIKYKLVQILLERAKVSGRNCQRLLMLCHGKAGSSHQSAPAMDMFISGRQLSPPTEHIELEGLDEIRLQSIVAHNAINRNMVSSTLERRQVFQGKDHGDAANDNFIGLWVLPSFINHSCVPNVSLVIIGKCIFVYASRDMDVGEELQCSYFNVFQPLPQRRELASRWWDFSCKCGRCLLEAKLATSMERLRYLHTQIQPTPTFAMRFPSCLVDPLAKDIATELEILDTSKKLDDVEKRWLQASFTPLYIISQDILRAHGNRPPLDTAFSAMEVVSSSSTSTLEVGLLCREYTGRDFKGKKTSKYKVVNQELIRICKCIFGKHRNTVLQSLVEGIPPK